MKCKEHSPELYETRRPFNFRDLREYLNKPEFKEWWVFRAQPACFPLKTTLERCCENWGLQREAHRIEEIMIREFRRVYEGEDRQDVRDDTLYCLSLLRHYGAPVRLLDFTYSKYIALYFGLECAYESSRQECPSNACDVDRSFALWCINTKQLYRRAENNYQHHANFPKHIKARAGIKTRGDKSFRPLYLENKYKMVISESPAMIHKRHHLQHSVFLCPGSAKVSFMANLLYFSDKTQRPDGIKKLTCKLSQSELEALLDEFRRMNITRESLFPGLDGFAESMKYQACFYRDMYKRIKQGERGYKK